MRLFKNSGGKCIILGSSSKVRLSLLRQIGLEPDLVISPEVDEMSIKGELPLSYCKRIAKEKNEKVVRQRDDALVITADTVTCCGRTILHKAEDPDYARYCLKTLSGRRHTIYSTVCVSLNKVIRKRTVKIPVSFKRLTDVEIDQYIESGEWLNKGGACSIGGLGGVFIKSINGSISGVMGLPLYQTYNLLFSFLD